MELSFVSFFFTPIELNFCVSEEMGNGDDAGAKQLRKKTDAGHDESGGKDLEEISPSQWDCTATCVWIRGQGLDPMVVEVP